MSHLLKVQVGKLSPFGFRDLSPHRQHLSPIYNTYNSITADPAYDPEKEDYLPIIKPLFATSFLSYHFLKDESFFDADQVILTSASSKTALGLAQLLKENQAEDRKQIVATTSAKNVAFVEQTAFYDEVIAYESMEKELPHKSSVVVDLAGNTDFLMRINEKLGDALKYICLIGFTDWRAGSLGKNIPKATFFFAPTQAKKIFSAWGPAEANLRIAKALKQFTSYAEQWIDLVHVQDNTEVQSLYLDMLNGKVDPSKGYIISIDPAS